MAYIRIYLFAALFLFVIRQGSAQDTVSNRIFNLVYNMEYLEAKKILHAEKASIDKLTYAVLEIDLSYWENVTGTNTPNYDAFEKTLGKYAVNTYNGFEQKGIQLICLSYQLRYQLKRYKFIDALLTYKKTKVLYEELKHIPKIKSFDNPDLFEIYNSMFLYFSNYLKPFGREERLLQSKNAILKMEELAKSGRPMSQTLCSYFLGKTYLKYEKEPAKAIPYFKALLQKYPNNSMFTKLLEESKMEIE
jgi:hypothetical protein